MKCILTYDNKTIIFSIAELEEIRFNEYEIVVYGIADNSEVIPYTELNSLIIVR